MKDPKESTRFFTEFTLSKGEGFRMTASFKIRGSMSIKEKLSADIKEKMKAKDAEALDCLRLIVSAAQNREIEKRSALTEAEYYSLLNTLSKQHQESIDMYTKGGRPELADKEARELKIIQSYLPAQLSETEITKIIEDAVKETGASGPRDMGKVMKAIQPKVQGRADGKVVSEIVKQKLS